MLSDLRIHMPLLLGLHRLSSDSVKEFLNSSPSEKFSQGVVELGSCNAFWVQQSLDILSDADER